MDQTPDHIAYLRAYEKDGHARVWIEGRRVADAGFAPGLRFAIRYDFTKREVELALTEGIGKKVHSKQRNGGPWPIIDLFNTSLDGVLRGVTRLRAEFRRGLIRLTAAPVAAAAVRRVERVLGSMASGRALACGSVFHGLGVLDHAVHEGLAAEGVTPELAFAVERDPTALDASLQNNPLWSPRSLAVLGDIQDVDPADLPSGIGLLTGGVPCQGASPQGRTARGLSAPEWHPEVGHLFLPFLRIIEATQPAVVLMENVPAYAQSIGFEMIRRTLANLGYDLEEATLSGNDFGALEDRRRLVAVARAQGLPPILAGIAGTPCTLSLADVLDPVPDGDPRWKAFEHVHRKLERDATKPGNGFKLNLLRPDARSVPTLIRGYETTKAWQPFVAHPSDPRLMRKFTAAEHARIKGVDPNLVRGLPETVAHALLGQAVVAPVFRAVGRAIARALRAARPARPEQGMLPGLLPGLAA